MDMYAAYREVGSYRAAADISGLRSRLNVALAEIARAQLGNCAVANERPPRAAASPGETPVCNCASGIYRPEKSSPPRTARPSRLI